MCYKYTTTENENVNAAISSIGLTLSLSFAGIAGTVAGLIISGATEVLEVFIRTMYVSAMIQSRGGSVCLLAQNKI